MPRERKGKFAGRIIQIAALCGLIGGCAYLASPPANQVPTYKNTNYSMMGDSVRIVKKEAIVEGGFGTQRTDHIKYEITVDNPGNYLFRLYQAQHKAPERQIDALKLDASGKTTIETTLFDKISRLELTRQYEGKQESDSEQLEEVRPRFSKQ